MTKFSEDAVQYMFALIDRRGIRHSEPAGAPRPAPPHAVILFSAALWAGFVAGAVLAGYMLPRFGLISLLAPIASVALIGIIDCARPLASSERSGAS
jgi:hypothetical protein